MRALSIDIETFSEASLPAVGVYKYASDPSFEILLFAYSIDAGPVKVVDLARGEQIPKDVMYALDDPTTEKWAFNAQFERVCISAALGIDLKPEGWHCSMVWATSLGMNLSLDGVAKALRLPIEKMSEGKKLIRYFSMPVKATKANGGRTRNQPEHDLDAWESFTEYCRRDVEVELQIQEKLARHPMPSSEWADYWLDQKINDRGVEIDLGLARAAVTTDEQHRAEVLTKAKAITGLENPNSVMQLRDWLSKNGLELDSLAKQGVKDAIETAEGHVKEALELRLEMAKSSVKKYEAMTKAAGQDSRARGLLQFMGAGRTGRWAGRLIQVQNLPRQHTPDLDVARTLVKTGRGEDLETLWGSVPNTLSELIRTAIVPAAGHRFIVADYSAIEARVIAWLASEKWVLDLFRAGGDIYCETGTRMFGVEVTKDSPLRQKSKVAVLACGYQGGPGALRAMGAVRMGIDEDELQGLVDSWRRANPRIVGLWHNIDAAAKLAISSGEWIASGHLKVHVQDGILFIELPSGRRLAYPSPKPGENRFGGESITHLGVGTNRRWERMETYGGKLVENIVQATARDILADSMQRLEKAGHKIVMHVHDEVVIEAPIGRSSVEDVCQIMSETPPWATGLPLDAEGFECTYYRKG